MDVQSELAIDYLPTYSRSNECQVRALICLMTSFPTPSNTNSEFDWHPFSISSSPGDDVTTHHIKARGPLTWTGHLLSLAKQAELVGSFRASELVMHVEGPYGMSVNYQDYNAIFLVAGGIGITPLHSTFRCLHKIAANSAPRYSKSRSRWVFPDRVHLLWVAPRPQVRPTLMLAPYRCGEASQTCTR